VLYKLKATICTHTGNGQANLLMHTIFAKI